MSRRAPDHVLLISRPENSKFDSSLTYFRSIDSKIPFTNAARVPHELQSIDLVLTQTQSTWKLCDRQNKLDAFPQISLALYFLVFSFDLGTRVTYSSLRASRLLNWHFEYFCVCALSHRETCEQSLFVTLQSFY